VNLPEVAALLREDPRTIGDYRILGRIGAGGMATVFLGSTAGSSMGTGSLVAVKLIHQHLAADDEFRARFAREVELAARVPAFCAAEVLGQGVHGDRPYLVTEYVPGMPLHRLVEAEGRIDPPTLHSIAVGLAAGLTAIHDCELVHRDLKPSNVIITRGGVRIIDFGIARSVDPTSDFTTTGVVMGSLGWTSPEQLDGRDPMPAMDIFAWGCLVAYAATGKHPFGGADAASRCWRILHADPVLDGLPPLLGDLVRAALDRDTGRRPTAQELLLGLVGARGPVVPVRFAASASPPVEPQGDEVSGASRGRWWTRGGRRRRLAELAGVPLGLVLASVVASAAGGPLTFGDEPAGAGERDSVTTPAIPPSGQGSGTRTAPGPGAGGRGAASDAGPVQDPGAPVPPGTPTLTPSPGTTTTTTTPPDDDEQGGPGNGTGNGNGNGTENGNGKGLTRSKKPRP
jgi:serine/threonine protein kinase